MSRRQCDVVVLRYLADMAEADVARELGVSVGSVKTHTSRGLSTDAPADGGPVLAAHPDAVPPAADLTC